MAIAEAAAPGIEEFLRRDRDKELLRFTTAGSVDDGKSTLIGRLLYDSRGAYEDQIAAIRKSPINRSSGPLDFSLLTDGLRAEREQGITIDVAYRHFATAKRKFIIADTPGHEQYTRNMATGASTADLAVILIDARNGVLPQSRRHAYIASLLGIPRIAVAVNKMDLVAYSREVFDRIRTEFSAHLERLSINDARFIPISALEGDNVARRSARMPWYDGGSLLEYLESVPLAAKREPGPLRFPVQYVLRPDLNFRGYAGQVASGYVRAGDRVMVLPSGRTSRVKSIVTYDGDLREAFPPISVTICLEHELDVSRGDMLVHPHELPHVSRQFEAKVVWMHERPLEPNQRYLLKHTTQQVTATVAALRYKVDVNTLERVPATQLALNEIGAVAIHANRPLFFDPYAMSRATGSFILIDPFSNATVAAGMIREARTEQVPDGAPQPLDLQSGQVTAVERYARAGHYPAAVWLTGRRELAHVLERILFDRGCQVYAVAGPEDARGRPEVTRALTAAGFIAIVSAPEDEPEERARAKDLAGPERFFEFPPERLASGDEQAAAQICAVLEREGIIRPLGGFDSGAGI